MDMVSGSIVGEYKSPVTIERPWEATICDSHDLTPKLLPQVISSLKETVGLAVSRSSTSPMVSVEEVDYVKDRIKVIDHKNHVFKYSIVEGGILGLKVNSYVAEVSFTSTNEGGCLATLKIEHESLGDSLLYEEEVATIKQGILTMVKAVEAYLLADPNAYV